MRSLSAPLVALAVVAALLMCAPTAAAATHNVNGTVGTAFSQSTGYGGGEHIGLWVGGQSGGLSFSSSSGVISGTPTAAGVYTLQVFWQIPLTENLRQTYTISIVSAGSAAPMAAFVSSAITGPAPLSIQFTDYSANALAWSWAFGDGNTSTQRHPAHTYAQAGTYMVTLTVNGYEGQDSYSRTITVTAAAAGGDDEPPGDEGEPETATDNLQPLVLGLLGLLCLLAAFVLHRPLPAIAGILLLAAALLTGGWI